MLITSNQSDSCYNYMYQSLAGFGVMKGDVCLLHLIKPPDCGTNDQWFLHQSRPNHWSLIEISIVQIEALDCLDEFVYHYYHQAPGAPPMGARVECPAVSVLTWLSWLCVEGSSTLTRGVTLTVYLSVSLVIRSADPHRLTSSNPLYIPTQFSTITHNCCGLYHQHCWWKTPN